MVVLEECVVPADHAPDGPLGGLEVPARRGLGDIDGVVPFLIPADYPYVSDGAFGHVDLGNHEVVAYARDASYIACSIPQGSRGGAAE